MEGKYDAYSGRGLFQCGICGKSFIYQGYIHTHLDKCHDIGPDQRIVQHQKDNKDPLEKSEEEEGEKTNKHECEEEEGEKTNKHECDECNQTFQQHDLLLAHKSSHFQTFKCYLCDKTYTAKQSLQNHAITAHSKYKNTPDYARLFK